MGEIGQVGGKTLAPGCRQFILSHSVLRYSVHFVDEEAKLSKKEQPVSPGVLHSFGLRNTNTPVTLGASPTTFGFCACLRQLLLEVISSSQTPADLLIHEGLNYPVSFLFLMDHYLQVCVCTCVCACTCVYCTHPHGHVCKPEVKISCLPQSVPTHLRLRLGLTLILQFTDGLCWLARLPGILLSLPPPPDPSPTSPSLSVWVPEIWTRSSRLCGRHFNDLGTNTAPVTAFSYSWICVESLTVGFKGLSIFLSCLVFWLPVWLLGP